MKENRNIIGADLAKKTIELFSQETKDVITIENNPAGFRKFIKWLKRIKVNQENAFIVMEHTGLYGYCFEEFLLKKGISFHMTNALNIKWSLGVTRGKTDKIDAARIAMFASQKKSELKQSSSASPSLKRLQMLQSTRERLIKLRKGLTNAIKEYQNITVSNSDILISSQQSLIKVINRKIEKIEHAIDVIIEGNEELNMNYNLIRSIKGVGPILATQTLIKTHNFTRFADARKFACYCGTAPFEYSSGTSIRGRHRVSHLADKKMKSLLTLAAYSAIQHCPEIKKYYEERIKKGKSKMSTINVVRNKLIGRMFAVVKRGTPYVEIYGNAA